MNALTPANFDLAPIRSMEPKIIDRLRLAFPAQLFTIERVPSALTYKEYTDRTRQSPFIGLGWVGMQPDGTSGRRLHGLMQWRLILILKAHTLAARFKGDTRDVGMDAMVDIATALLQGAPIAEIGYVAVTGAKAVYAEGTNDDDVILSEIDFQIRYETSPAPFGLVAAPDLTNFAITWLATDPETEVGDPDISQNHNPNAEDAG